MYHAISFVYEFVMLNARHVQKRCMLHGPNYLTKFIMLWVMLSKLFRTLINEEISVQSIISNSRSVLLLRVITDVYGVLLRRKQPISLLFLICF